MYYYSLILIYFSSISSLNYLFQYINCNRGNLMLKVSHVNLHIKFNCCSLGIKEVYIKQNLMGSSIITFFLIMFYREILYSKFFVETFETTGSLCWLFCFSFSFVLLDSMSGGSCSSCVVFASAFSLENVSFYYQCLEKVIFYHYFLKKWSFLP